MRLLRSIENKRPRSKARGNSTTLLLGAMSIVSIALSLTSVMLAPINETTLLSRDTSQEIERVMDHHLLELDNYLQNNQQLFARSNWSSLYNNPNDNMPNYRQLTQTAFNQLPANLREFTETIRLSSGNTLVVRSKLHRDNNNNYSLYHYNEAPYQNTIKAVVESGPYGLTGTLSRAKTISLAIDRCNTNNLGPLTRLTIPNFFGENGNFNIGLTSGPFFQVGDQFVCTIPSRTQTDPVSCSFRQRGLYLLSGSNKFGLQQANINSDYTSNIFVAYRTPALAATAQWRLQLTVGWDGNRTLSRDVLLPNYSTSNPQIENPIYIETLPPRVGQSGTYSLIFYRNASGQLIYTWARWDLTRIYDEGIFASTPQTQIVDSNIDSYTFFSNASANPGRLLAYTVNQTTTPFRREVAVLPVQFPLLLNTTSSPPAIYPATLNSVPGAPLLDTDNKITNSPIRTGNPNSNFSRTDSNTIRFGKLVVSDDGKFVLFPLQHNIRNGANVRTAVSVIAFNTENIFINTRNEALRTNLNPEGLLGTGASGGSTGSTGSSGGSSDPFGLYGSSGQGSWSPPRQNNSGKIPPGQLVKAQKANGLVNGISISNEGTNWARLISFAQSPNRTDGERNLVSDVSAVKIMYNKADGAFYIVINADASNNDGQNVYRWDPDFWGYSYSSASPQANSVEGSFSTRRKQKHLLGSLAGTSSFAGVFKTVQEIRPATGVTPTRIWPAGGLVDLRYNAKRNEFLAISVNRVLRIDLTRGYLGNVADTLNVNQSSSRSLAFDNHTGKVYISLQSTPAGQTSTLYVWDSNNPGQAPQPLLPNSQLNVANRPAQGDGNMMYVKHLSTMFVMDLPATVTSTTRPALIALTPQCVSKTSRSSYGIIPGYQRTTVLPVSDRYANGSDKIYEELD